MKLPRWLVAILLTANFAAVLGAGAWFWVTWPERTAQEFVRRLANKEELSWVDMLPSQNDPIALDVVKSLRPTSWSDVKPRPRSLLEFLLCQRRFDTSDDVGWGFTVERGSVIGISPSGEALVRLLKPVRT
jgi:hypothetical protein